jgi:hypothetical protein
MKKVTQPMLTMSFKDVKERITTLQTARTIAEENRLMSEKDILRAKIMQAERELIKSTILFFHYLEESKIKF